jgi:hypothetical protein
MAAIAGQAAWNQWIEQAKNAEILGVVSSFGAQLKRTGTAEFAGPCPLCAGTDRFSVNVKKKVCNCRKCGLKGDVVNFVETMTGGSFLDACERINGTPRPDRSRDETFEEKNARLERNGRRLTDFQQREDEQQQIEAARAKRDEEAIAAILDRAVTLDKPLAAHGLAYLRARGLNPNERLIKDIRFVPDLDYWGARDNGTRSVVHLANLPAIVALIRDFSGLVIGISQTYLDPHEPRKWRPEGSPTNSAKKIRGEKKHGMILLYGRPSETLAIGEGWENCLAWHQMGYGPEDVALAAAIDLGNLAGAATGPWPHPVLKDGDGKPARITNAMPDPSHPGIILPDGIKSIILLADLDSETYSTAAKLLTAGRRFRNSGIHVDIAWPLEAGKDWNDCLINVANEHGGPFSPRPSLRTD